MSYPQEKVPGSAKLYKYFPRSKYDDRGRPKKTAYMSVRSGMSANWDKYCTTAEQCRSRLDKSHTFGVVTLHVECIESGPNAMVVTHSPKCWPDSPELGQSHVDVLLDNEDLEQHYKLYHLAVPALAPDPPQRCESEERRLKKAGKTGA